MTDAGRFMQPYMEVWPSFDVDRPEEAINPDATIYHSGLVSPILGAEEPDYARAIKALMPDVELEVANWAARGTWCSSSTRSAAPSRASRSTGPRSDASSCKESTRSTPSVVGTIPNFWRRSTRTLA